MTSTYRQGNMMKRTSTLTVAVLLLMVLTIPVLATGNHHGYCEWKPWKCTTTTTTTTTAPETTTTVVEETTTTTTVPTTTTLPAETTTTVMAESTTTQAAVSATSITSPPSTAGPFSLPFTGADMPFLLLTGLALFGLGGVLVRSARRDGV